MDRQDETNNGLHLVAVVLEEQEQQVPEDVLKAEISRDVAAARSLEVKDQFSYNLAAEMVLALAERRKRIIAHHAEMKAKAYAAHQAVCKAERDMLDPVIEVEKIIDGKLAKYTREQREVAEQARLAAVAAENARQEENTLHAVIEAEQAGAGPEEVEAIWQEPRVFVRPVVAAPAFQAVKGLSVRTTYKCDRANASVDIKALCKAIAEGRCATSDVIPNWPALDARARSQGPEMMKFTPGIKVVQDTSVGKRGGKVNA